MSKKYLKGFANLGMFEVITNTASAYACGTTRTELVGAASCAPTDNRTEFSIPADDGVYDSGTDWTDTTLVIGVREMDLAYLGQILGSEFDTELKEGTFDEPNEVALTFSALRRDGGYRLYRYFCCKCTGYKVTHTTKGENNDSQDYELTFKCTPRNRDNLIRTTKDVDKGMALTYITSMEDEADASTETDTDDTGTTDTGDGTDTSGTGDGTSSTTEGETNATA